MVYEAETYRFVRWKPIGFCPLKLCFVNLVLSCLCKAQTGKDVYGTGERSTKPIKETMKRERNKGKTFHTSSKTAANQCS